MRDILKNIFYKSTQNDTSEELIFKIDIARNTPELKQSDGPSLEGEDISSLPGSLKEESDFPSSSTSASSSQSPIYHYQKKSNTREKEKVRKKVYSKLLTHVKEYLEDDGRKFDKNKKIALFEERDFKAYIYPLEKDFIFGYQYHHVQLIPFDETHFSPHMTRHFNVYVKRDKQTTVESLKFFEDQLEKSATR